MIEVIKHENTRMLREERRGGDKKVSDIRPTERERERREREWTIIRSTTSRGPGSEALTSPTLLHFTQAKLHLYIRSQTSDKKEAAGPEQLMR